MSKQLIQTVGVQCIHDYIKENNISIDQVQNFISKEYQYKRCEGGGAYVCADFYIIDGNFYTNWQQ